MKLLRLTIFGSKEAENDDWMTLWFSSKAEVEDYLSLEIEGNEAALETVEVPMTREGLACALNLAEVNPVTWPGTRIKNIDLRNKKQ